MTVRFEGIGHVPALMANVSKEAYELRKSNNQGETSKQRWLWPFSRFLANTSLKVIVFLKIMIYIIITLLKSQG